MHVSNVTFNSDVINDETHFYFMWLSKPFELFQFSIDLNEPFFNNIKRAFDYMMKNYGFQPLEILIPLTAYSKYEGEADPTTIYGKPTVKQTCEYFGLRWFVMIPDTYKRMFDVPTIVDEDF